MAPEQPGRRAFPLRGARAHCPVLVGRDGELVGLRTLLDAAGRGCGATVVVRGEAGIGKSRLAREVVAAARARSMTALVGRSLQHGQAPYRPLTEALFAVARAGPLPDAAQLRPFRHALGTVVPDWREDGGGGEESSVVVGEGVLRLARVIGAAAGTLLVVEDLHWADADTMATIEYLADNVAQQPVVLLVTVRPGEAAAASELVSRLEIRGAAQVVELGRLRPAEVATMVAACAGERGLADGVSEIVGRRSEGLPLLVEELLSVPVSGIAQAVPGTFADAVARRLAAVAVESRLVVECAAVLGRRFDWRLLAAVTGMAPSRVRGGLADAVAAGLLVTDAEGEFTFPHALTRDAVLTGLLAPTRIALARRAARAVGLAADDDTHVLLAADLWCAAGEPDVAARGLVDAGRRAIARGALVTAERLLERARTVGVDEPVRAAGAEALAEALALAAKVDGALTVGAEALELLHAAPAARRARLHLVLARAADAAARWSLATEHLARARALGGAAPDERLLAAVDALSAHVAMGELRYDDAAHLATAAADRALELELPEVACEALEVVGRRERLRDVQRAEAVFQRAHGIAQDSGLALWSIRTLHELGTIDMLVRSSPARLLRASELAYRAGALSLAATVDLQLTGLHGYLFEIDAALDAGTRAAEVASALGLTEVHTGALLQLGFAHAIAGRRGAMDDAVEAALRLAEGRAEPLSWAWGHVRATASLLAEDRARALEEMSVALGWARRAASVTTVFTALCGLLRVVEGAGREAVDEVCDVHGTQVITLNQAIVELAESVLDARAGHHERAAARAAAAEAVLREIRMDAWRHLSLRLLAEAALDGGWGEPHRWLAEAMAFFERSGHDRVVGACRDLLRRAGRPVRRAADGVPDELRAAGMTGREVEVLRLLGERMSNREIAERLYLSPRTVEKHVERLLHKAGLGTRTELGRLAREIGT